jgi:hypothetical protein
MVQLLAGAAGQEAVPESVSRRNSRQELAATASDETSMVMAATQGSTSPAAAIGVISKCQITEP